MKIVKKLSFLLSFLLLASIMPYMKVNALGTAPVNLKLSVNKTNFIAGDTVTISMSMDNKTDYSSAYIWYKDPVNTYNRISSKLNYDSTAGIFKGTINVGQYNFTNGTWIVDSVSLTDKTNIDRYINNSSLYSDTSMNLLNLDGGNFSVSGSILDKKAPILASIGVDKKTAVPNDTVKITVTASDDVSGLRNCYIYIYKPDGTTEYRNLNSIGSGQFQCSYAIGPYSQNGPYKIKLLDIADAAGNYATYYNNTMTNSYGTPADLSGADFSVSGANPDTNPPVMKSITLDKTTAVPGDFVTFTANITDDVSGINGSVQLELRNPEGEEEYFYLRPNNGLYSGAMYINKYLPAGTYSLLRVNIWDRAGNHISYKGSEESYGDVVMDFSGCSFTVSGTINDKTSPVFTGITVSKKTATIGDSLSFNINCSDSESGIRTENYSYSYNNVSRVTYISPSGNKITYNVNKSGSTYSSLFNVGKYTEAGLWKVYTIYLYDEAGNSLVVGNSSIQYDDSTGYDMEGLSAADFTVGGTISDKDVPAFIGINSSRKSMYNNQINTVSIQASDTVSGLAQGYEGYNNPVNIVYLTPGGYISEFSLKLKDGILYSDITAPRFNAKGLWKAAAVNLKDNAGNIVTYVNSNLNEEELSALGEEINMYNNKSVDLSGGNFNVLDSESDTTAPALKGVSVDKPTLNGAGTVTLSFNINENTNALVNRSIGFVEVSSPGRHTYDAPIVRENGSYIGKIALGPYEENGVWKINSVYLYDEAGNGEQTANTKAYTTQYGEKQLDMSPADFTVSGMKLDNTPPAFSKIVLSTRNVSVSGTVKVDVYAVDDVSGISTKDHDNYITYDSPSGKTVRDVELQYANGVLSGSLSLNKYDESGTWRVKKVSVSDCNGNRMDFYNSRNPSNAGTYYTNSADLSAYDIVLSGTSSDNTKPVFIGVSADRTSVNPGETVGITVNATDDSSGMSYGYIYYVTSFGYYVEVELAPVNGVLKGTLDTGVWGDKQGIWKIDDMYIYDNAGNELIVGNYKYDYTTVGSSDKMADLSSADITVSGSVYGDTNGDDTVDIFDLALSARSYNLKSSSVKWESRIDINKDNIVDIYDMVIISRRIIDTPEYY